MQPSLPQQRHAGRCDDIPDTVGVRGGKTSPQLSLCRVRAPRRRHPRIGPLRRPDGQPLRHHPRSRSCAGTGRATMPRCHDLDEIRQDGRQLHDTSRHASTRRRIAWHACKSPFPWPIKGRAIPRPQGTTATRNDGLRTHPRIPPSPRYWHLSQSIPLGLGGQASSPSTLVAPLYEHHGATQYSASSTPLLDIRPRSELG
jgi:hypothetical protein